ncbi:MAG TPA: FAD-dependent oxidoreductase [Acidimicrobiia bacterium]|jgi:NADH dehydrogenase FAD-containing subunit
MSRPRVLAAGLGDTGLLTAIHLSRHADVVGVSAKPAHVSGQELGVRLTRPDDWSRDYRIAYERYRRLDDVRVVHGSLTGVDLDAREVGVLDVDGAERTEPYDILVIATGVTNGFWRRPDLASSEQVDDALRSQHDQIASAASVIVIGGGAAAVSGAVNIATTWPDKQVDLYFPGDRALPRHHPRVWPTNRARLEEFGVGLHPGHRAVVPDGFACDAITTGRVTFSTGQEPATAEAVLWTVGRVEPNTGWLPAEILTDDGFVRVDPDLSVPGYPGVFAIGDVAATDPLRTSARNRADKLLARNVRAHVDGRPLRTYRPPTARWGSVVGPQHDGLTVFTASGRTVRFPAWSTRVVLMDWITRRGIYKGVRS